jgi:arylsulfatase A-like enzyme
MDRKVGSILEELSADSLLEKTYVIFLSDHGGPLPRQKREIISSGLEVPMIIRFPGRERGGTVDDRLISFIDLAPTFLSLAGIPVPDHIHGEAFLGEQESAPRKYIHGARDRMDTEYDRCRSVSDGEFFYVKNYHPELPWVQDIDYRENMGIMKCLMSMHDHDSLDDVEELWFMETKPEEMLFHSETDPWEVKNLASDPAYRTKLLELREAHHQWLHEYGDMGIMPESIMVKQMWPEYVQPRTANPVCFMDSNNISISCKTPGSSIAYHIDRDNSVPDPAEPNNWKLYTGPVYLNEDEYIHVKAIRIGYADSEVVSILPKNKKTISSYTQNTNND